MSFFKKIGDTIKENPKTAAAIGGGTLAVAAAPLALAAAAGPPMGVSTPPMPICPFAPVRGLIKV